MNDHDTRAVRRLKRMLKAGKQDKAAWDATYQAALMEPDGRAACVAMLPDDHEGCRLARHRLLAEDHGPDRDESASLAALADAASVSGNKYRSAETHAVLAKAALRRPGGKAGLRTALGWWRLAAAGDARHGTEAAVAMAELGMHGPGDRTEVQALHRGAAAAGQARSKAWLAVDALRQAGKPWRREPPGTGVGGQADPVVGDRDHEGTGQPTDAPGAGQGTPAPPSKDDG